MSTDNNYVRTNVDGFVKDSSTGAILNVDNSRLDAYRKQKQFINNNIKNNERIERVEQDLSEIKQMLQALLRENNK